MIHRDIRPGNIFCFEIDFPMSIALRDFGSAMYSTHAKLDQDVQTSHVGVVLYMSINICRGVPYGPSSDMWSVGVLLQEMLVGKTPFRGSSAEESLQLIKRREILCVIWKMERHF